VVRGRDQGHDAGAAGEAGEEVSGARSAIDQLHVIFQTTPPKKPYGVPTSRTTKKNKKQGLPAGNTQQKIKENLFISDDFSSGSPKVSFDNVRTG
jgi:hypothetical protein